MRCRVALAAMLPVAIFLAPGVVSTDPIEVRHVEGSLRALFALRAIDGSLLGNGDLLEHTEGNRVISRLTFRFRDGSVQDESTVFTQRGRFRLISDRLTQSGPTFRQPLEMSIDGQSGQVTVQYKENGKEATETAHFDLLDDVANGIVPVLLKNLNPGGPLPALSIVAATPKPRLVKLAVAVAGTDSVSMAGAPVKAVHYVLRPEIGGLTGLIAPMVGRQPPDTHVWIRSGDAPTFVKSEGPLFYEGPSWRIELTSTSSSTP